MSRYEIVISQYGAHFGTLALKVPSREVAEIRFKRLAAELSPRLGYQLTLVEWSTPVGRDLLTQEAAK